jgi:hypothetical protein
MCSCSLCANSLRHSYVHVGGRNRSAQYVNVSVVTQGCRGFPHALQADD